MALFENLVFEGGGVRGIAYAGAVSVLDDAGLLAGVKRVAGTSAGAFMAMLLSLHYSPAEARTILGTFDFTRLEDSPNPLRVPTHYGLYKGEVLHDWAALQLTNKGFSAGATFADLAAKGARDLKIFATDLTAGNVREFSATTTPGASVAGAVRASMSVPLLYAAWQFPDGQPDDHFYVDGGAVYNYPINAFDDAGGINATTLGFCFMHRPAAKKAKPLGHDNLVAYSHQLFAALLGVQAIDFNLNPAEIRRSVRIDDLGYKATDLGLSKAGFDGLYQSGQGATRQYLANLRQS